MEVAAAAAQNLTEFAFKPSQNRVFASQKSSFTARFTFEFSLLIEAFWCLVYIEPRNNEYGNQSLSQRKLSVT